MNKTTLIISAVIVFLVMVKGAVIAVEAEETFPTVQQQGNISYITGGVGDEEKAYMKALSREYNLQIMNASASGEFVADSNIIIRDTSGTELLNTQSQGPFFYALLPSGKYTLEANYNNERQSRSLSLGKSSPTVVNLYWK